MPGQALPCSSRARIADSSRGLGVRASQGVEMPPHPRFPGTGQIRACHVWDKRADVHQIDAFSTQGALGGKRGVLSSQSTFQRVMGKQNVPNSGKGHFFDPPFAIFLCLSNTLLKRTLQERGMLFRGHVEAKNNWPPFLAKESQFKDGFICRCDPITTMHTFILVSVIGLLL